MLESDYAISTCLQFGFNVFDRLVMLEVNAGSMSKPNSNQVASIFKA